MVALSDTASVCSSSSCTTTPFSSTTSPFSSSAAAAHQRWRSLFRERIGAAVVLQAAARRRASSLVVRRTAHPPGGGNPPALRQRAPSPYRLFVAHGLPSHSAACANAIGMAWRLSRARSGLRLRRSVAAVTLLQRATRRFMLAKKQGTARK